MTDLTKYRQIDFDFVEPKNLAQTKQDLNRLRLAMKTMEAELYAAKNDRPNRDPDPLWRQWRNHETDKLNAIRRRYSALKAWVRDHATPVDDGRRDVRTDLTHILTGDLVYELKLRVQSLENIALMAIGYRDAWVTAREQEAAGSMDMIGPPGDEQRYLESLRRAVAIYEGLQTTQEQRNEPVI